MASEYAGKRTEPDNAIGGERSTAADEGYQAARAALREEIEQIIPRFVPDADDDDLAWEVLNPVDDADKRERAQGINTGAGLVSSLRDHSSDTQDDERPAFSADLIQRTAEALHARMGGWLEDWLADVKNAINKGPGYEHYFRTRTHDDHDQADVLESEVQIQLAAECFAQFMAALGHAPTGQHLRDTPRRVAKMYAELLTPAPFTMTTFESDSRDMVTVRDIPFTSFCAHHFLPFTGVAHVAYIPNGKIVGLSKLARVVQMCSAAPSVQEDLTSNIASFLQEAIGTMDVAVLMQARHQCMELRGVKSIGAVTITSSLQGDFYVDGRTRAEFLQFAHG